MPTRSACTTRGPGHSRRTLRGASKADGEAGDAFSSLYFDGGRLRLAHDSGARVVESPGVRRVCLSAAGKAAFEKVMDAAKDYFEVIDLFAGTGAFDDLARELKINRLGFDGLSEPECDAVRTGNTGWVTPAVIGAAGQLFEVLAARNCHISRGRPFAAPALTQRQINGLHAAAKDRVPTARMVEIYAYIIAHP